LDHPITLKKTKGGKAGNGHDIERCN
jgi:hypothetical protein